MEAQGGLGVCPGVAMEHSTAADGEETLRVLVSSSRMEKTADESRFMHKNGGLSKLVPPPLSTIKISFKNYPKAPPNNKSFHLSLNPVNLNHYYYLYNHFKTYID